MSVVEAGCSDVFVYGRTRGSIVPGCQSRDHRVHSAAISAGVVPLRQRCNRPWHPGSRSSASSRAQLTYPRGEEAISGQGCSPSRGTEGTVRCAALVILPGR